MLKYQPKSNTILICDFVGFIQPEMVKKRPVLVFKKNSLNPYLVTVIPISTTKPDDLNELHIQIESPIDGQICWLKCDMLTTVCLSRLDRIRIKKDHKTEYVTKSLDTQTYNLVKKTVAKYFGFYDN